MTFKAGTRLGIGAATLLLIVALGAQTAGAQTADRHQAKRHAHHQRHHRHHPRPDLDLRLDVSPVVAATGSQVTYTATVTNRSRRSAPGAGFLNRIPGQTSFVSASPSQGSCSGNQLVFCNLGPLAPRTSATVTVVVTANHAGRITDVGWVSNNPPRHWQHERHATSWVRDMSPNLDLRLTGSPGVVDSGQQVTYTATITNRGSAATATAGFQDVIPGGTTFVSASPSQGSCSGNSTIVCNLGGLNPGAAATVTIVVGTTQGGHITDRGWVSTNPPNDWHHQRSVTTYVRNVSPNLDLRLTGSPGAVDSGQQVTYTAQITNRGSGAAANAGFQDVIPGGTTFVSAAPSQGSCSGNQTVVCNLGALNPGAGATVTIVVATTQPGHITDRGWVSTNPPNDWQHQRSVTTYVRNVSPALDFHLVGSPSAVSTGQQVTYTATIGNHGSGAAANAAFQDLIPPNTTLASVTPSQGTCSGNPTIVCNLGSLAPGATATVAIVVTTTQSGNATDRGWISTNPPGDWRHERDVTTAVRDLAADLDFHLIGSPSAVNAGQQVTYTATVGNHGPGTASNAGFQDVLPGKVTLVSVTPSQGTCSGNPTFVCSLGSLAPGATATVTIVVATTQPGSIVDRGWVSTSPPGGWRHERDAVTDVKAAPPATTAAATTTTTTSK
jgi:uncharacterized repeat protein (TIGR01451 family)